MNDTVAFQYQIRLKLSEEKVATLSLEELEELDLKMTREKPIMAPPKRVVRAGTKLYKVSPIGCTEREIKGVGWYLDEEKDIKVMKDFYKQCRAEGIRLEVFEVVKGFNLFSLDPEYNFCDLEQYIASRDPDYKKTFDHRGRGDHGVVANWVRDHAEQFGVDGWWELMGLLVPLFMVEGMILDTAHSKMELSCSIVSKFVYP
ncbi:MAG: hypothetical protein Hyperionvirus1_101 [Hyperionvirus sp.]|uniref:Uncharacterized protein n=1 Tax=Hyperionvirus sp. TaxID=2487770 RepID=A0A3G5A673_9VIRU|nr:MAG: hypothetical protein Hyperionvirus1_101 [Hyperionvirus sp.]